MVLSEAGNISRSRLLLIFNLIATVLAASLFPAMAASEGSPTPIILKGSQDADLIIQVGDIDNLGFGWPDGFDVFSGLTTEKHDYPFQPEADDPNGTDRIMIGSGYDGHPPAGLDGYTRTAEDTASQAQTIEIRYDLSGVPVNSSALQIFVDDLQPSVYDGYIQVKINGRRAPFLEKELNLLDLSGPVGRLVSAQVPQEFQNDISSGRFDLLIDDPATGAGDGYAVDFVRLLINPRVNYSKSSSVKAATGLGSIAFDMSRDYGRSAGAAVSSLVDKMESAVDEIGGVIGMYLPSSEQGHITASFPADVPSLPSQNASGEADAIGEAVLATHGAYAPTELDAKNGTGVKSSTISTIPAQPSIAAGIETASSAEARPVSSGVVAIASDGGCNLYKAVYDPVSDRSDIMLQASSGLKTTLAAVSGRVGGLSTDGSGSLLVSHAGQISMISPDGSSLTIASGLDTPGQIAPCGEGVYVIVRDGVQRIDFPTGIAEQQDSRTVYDNMTGQRVQSLEGGTAANVTEAAVQEAEAYQEIQAPFEAAESSDSQGIKEGSASQDTHITQWNQETQRRQVNQGTQAIQGNQATETDEELQEYDLPQASGNLLFIEVWTDRHGQAERGMPPKLMIDFPSYELDNQTIRSFVPVDIPAQVLAVGGTGFSLSGDLGGGANSGLEPILMLPYELGGVNVTAISGDRVTVDHAGESRDLLPGEVWEIRRSEIQSNKDVTLNITTTTTVKNHGRVDLKVEENV